jgi:hypothetical protein
MEEKASSVHDLALENYSLLSGYQIQGAIPSLG